MALDKTQKGADGEAEAAPGLGLSDHQLIEAAKAGDGDAYGEIIAKYKNPITNFLFRFLNDYEEAVELAQETFVRVYFALDRYHTKFAFSTYIYRIAANLAITELRKRKRRSVLSLTGLFQTAEECDTEFQPPDTRPLPDSGVVDAERDRAIARAIASLPPKYRLPLVLRDIDECSYDEVAEILGLGLGTTKSRISRARGMLRERLGVYLKT